MELKNKLVLAIVLCSFWAPFCNSATSTGELTTSTVLDISAPDGNLIERGNTAWQKIKISYKKTSEVVGKFLTKQVDAIKIEYDREKKEMLDDIKEYMESNRLIRIIMIFLEQKIAPKTPGEGYVPCNGNKQWFA